MNLRSGRGSTSARTGHGLGEDQGENGRGDDNGNANGESHEAPLLGPPSPLPPSPMTHAKMMVARRELARALEMLAQAIGGFAHGGTGGNGGNGGGALFLSGLFGDTPAHVHTDC